MRPDFTNLRNRTKITFMATIDSYRSPFPHEELLERARRIRHVALDMDGTIYMGMSLFPWTKRFLSDLTEMGIGYSFLTNNPSKSIADYLHKLETLGIEATREEMYTTALATIDYIRSHYPTAKRLFLLGTPSMISEFEAAGFESTADSAEDVPDVVVAAFDMTLTYPRLCRAAWWASQGIPYIATNPDRVCPTDQPVVLVDCGSICKCLEHATGRTPDIVLGKPEADSNVGGVIADGTPDEVFGHMGQVLADGGAWVPGRTIESHAPKPEQIRQPQDVVLYTRDLSFGYDFPLGEHIDLEFHSGEVTALTGRNGVGKSTLGLTLAGLLKPIAGRVCMADDLVPPHRENNVIIWKSRDLLGRIGMVFQEPEHQFAASTVRDEVAIGPKSMGKTDEEAYSIADRLLERLNLSRFAKANPFTLSGGEKRRLSVASMLAAAPKVLVMDEPTFGQDFTTWTSMVQLIAGARDQGCAVIMITHDEPLIEALGARRILVREGE